MNAAQRRAMAAKQTADRIRELEAALAEAERERDRAIEAAESWRLSCLQAGAEVRELKARIDAAGDYQVYIVPGERHLQMALGHLEPDAREGDRARVADSGREFIRQDGTWKPAAVLKYVRRLLFNRKNREMVGKMHANPMRGADNGD